jgi:PKD repeat protein
VTKTFDKPGEHVVSLTVVNRAGERTNRERVVKVSNARPDAEFSYSPSEPRLDGELNFDASGSSDPAGEIQSYNWEFGDGTTASGESVNHSYDEYGEYQVSLTVSDGETTDTKTRTLVVDNLAPEPVVGFDSLPDEPTVNDEVVLNASDSYDPDGDGIAGYTWRFENGETATGAVVSHSFAEPGTREVTVTVSDGTDSTNRTVTVDIVNRPPEADFSHSPRTPQQQATQSVSTHLLPRTPIKTLRSTYGSSATGKRRAARLLSIRTMTTVRTTLRSRSTTARLPMSSTGLLRLSRAVSQRMDSECSSPPSLSLPRRW